MPKSQLPKLRVLIADPSPHMAGIAAAMLRTLHVKTIHMAVDAGAAMSELKRRDFGVLLLDDALTGIDSTEFVRKLRACEDCANRHVPVIMMSALPSAAHIAAARDAGVTEFLRKPFAAAHLEARLISILAAPRPFIAAPTYAGPDRRRRKLDYTGTERRSGETQDPAGEAAEV